MSFLIDWISQIVLFIFLATLISLLIPKTSHEKVIKVVFGMIIFLLFLHPLSALFQINPETIVSEFELPELSITPEEMEIEISNKKSEIQASSDAYILEQLEQSIKSSVEEELVQQYDIAILDVFVQLDDSNDGEELDEIIEQVTFHLTEGNVVREVEVVQIPAEQSEDGEDLEQIKRTISSFLGLPVDSIIIEWEGE
ncbi:stage III sporulation protein AF [Alkalibacillus filiformis]|uniref:Stage III sporulation protein AF n=1 Tax=Alkalibacillus filiformis TaxID=200990 RepID=A0ABU0DRB1_9BACI|nr:stage III sporulation protein AF [Alkalibacillus filiformis]MDQ0350988.1 stage III sporulation protein AF [Alkalibacillus filiformis]